MFSKSKFKGLTQAISLLPLLAAVSAHGQAVERHLPAVPQGTMTPIATPNAVPSEQDATPIGPDLRAIVLLGASEAAHNGAGDGVTVGDVARLKSDPAIAGILRPYLGKPLSRKLIAEIEAAVARHYRDLNYPFVSLSTPEQEITGGVVQVRVVEFRAGKVSVGGASEKEAARLRGEVGLQSGQAIDARELTYDLDWINRYPFRSVQAMFAPGDQLGVSDLTLAVRHGKPWQLYAGYSNDGSPTTSFDRYFVGGAIGGVFGADSILSLQSTASRDALQGADDPHYKSTALSYTLPFGRRGQIEASADAVETFQPGNPFSVRLKAAEGTLGYRFAISDLYGDRGATDVRFGIEARHQTGITYFGKLDVYDISVETYQLYLGYHHSGRSVLDLAVHMSPGGLNGGNSDEQAILYSQGRQKGATYSYLTGTYSRTTPIGHVLALKTEAIGQFSAVALPRTEQAGLGGSSLVRGYTLDNGAFDTALVVRNELRGPAKSWGVSAQVTPLFFVDAGYGRDNAARETRGVASAGAGAEVHLTRHVMMNIDAACALAPDQATRAGSWLAHANVNVAF
ncbi:ShlB/FhaC/HecB family hemolysin secretion/activation protein [Asticcacaulis solisilvae]|uniref:ShlB/FhaC/HecB family hemolysin secretion/activation protein n=1 Tax=Asticcacaulis solisilvae TaxID=1217274 RepID=UPI003FD828C6